MKKLLSVCLLLCMLLCCLQLPVMAEEDDEYDIWADEEDYDSDWDADYDYDGDYADGEDPDEEDYSQSNPLPFGSGTSEMVVAAATTKVYAGATPIPIDPVDMPTATPRPELSFTFTEYTANNLGLTFSAAVGYEVNDTLSDLYVLTEPMSAMHDNYQCVITLQTSSITRSYTTKDLQTDLKNYLSNEGKKYATFESAQAASTTMLGGKGYYNNYRGVLSNGTIVRGRVCMAIIDNSRVLTLHISNPAGFNTSYLKIFTQIKNTLKAR